MERKITIQQFSEKVAEAAGMPKEETLAIIKQIFNNVAERLHDGAPVEVNGLGRFELTKTCAQRVNFIPDDALAQAVNEPFQSFSAVELSEDYTDEVPEETDESVETESPQEETVETIAEATTSIPADLAPAAGAEADEMPADNETAESEETIASQPSIEPDNAVTEEVAEVEEVCKTVVMPPIAAKEAEAAPPVPPAIPVVPPTPPATPEPVMMTPPPFDPVRAYSVPENTPEEDVEEFIGQPDGQPEATESKSSRFWFGLISGLVIAAAIGALAYFVYEVFIV